MIFKLVTNKHTLIRKKTK